MISYKPASTCKQKHPTHSIVVSGSPNRWYVMYNHPIGNIYHLYTTCSPIGWLYISPTKPTYFSGNPRNNLSSLRRGSCFAIWCSHSPARAPGWKNWERYGGIHGWWQIPKDLRKRFGRCCFVVVLKRGVSIIQRYCNGNYGKERHLGPVRDEFSSLFQDLQLAGCEPKV